MLSNPHETVETLTWEKEYELFSIPSIKVSYKASSSLGSGGISIINGKVDSVEMSNELEKISSQYNHAKLVTAIDQLGMISIGSKVENGYQSFSLTANSDGSFRIEIGFDIINLKSMDTMDLNINLTLIVDVDLSFWDNLEYQAVSAAQKAGVILLVAIVAISFLPLDAVQPEIIPGEIAAAAALITAVF